MGLDMYLHRRKKGSAGLPEPEVAYWRKANQIRQWFVDHTGYDADADCEEHIVTQDQLEALLDDCKTVQENHDLAPEILPTSGGFFFGSENYDNGYFKDISTTIEQIEDILADTDFETDEIVYYEWW